MAQLQERDKSTDEAVYQVRRLMEEWKNRITLDNLRLGERYLEGRLDVLLHWEFVGTGCVGEATHFVTVFRHEQPLSGCPSGNGVKIDHWPLSLDSSFGGETTELNQSGYCRTYDQVAVLVDNVKVVNQPQKIVPPVSSLVRFGFPNEFYGTRRESLYYSRHLGFVFGSRFTDRKLMLSSRLAAAGLNELPDQMIQGGSQVVYGVADDTGEIVGDFGSDFNPKDLLSRLYILFEDDSMSVGLAKGRELLFKLSDMVFGPFDFQPDTDQSVGS
jgi:hypothetical protein